MYRLANKILGLNDKDIDMPKYKLTLNHLEQQGDCRKLERDGFSKEEIHKILYKETDGGTADDRRNIMSKLYDRRKDGL